MEDVARQAGVSLGTVSNVLNKPHMVSEKTREKVREAIQQLGFVPDRRARALAAGTSKTIGFVVIDLSNSFFLDMARGAEQEAQTAGFNVLLADSDMQVEKERVYMELFDEERVAGILLAPLPSPADDVVTSGRWGRDVVVLNSPVAEDRCSVIVDDEVGGYRAARHLIERGRRRLVFAGGPDTLAPVRNRRRGVERAVAETNGAVGLSFLKSSELQAPDGRKLGHRLAAMAAGERPDGIVAAADLLALGMIQAVLAETELRFPEDLSLIGYDDNRAAWDSVVPITTMAQPGTEMGRVGARLLIEEIRSGRTHRHEHVVLEPTLLVRESS
ncbi:MAG TPA: LacI family DNA-binding transcriptional regulator [Marmoricola sp.]|nr:LacI family DNA-binding transcriptional regulator [Marmoricola sp.]